MLQLSLRLVLLSFVLCVGMHTRACGVRCTRIQTHTHAETFDLACVLREKLPVPFSSLTRHLIALTIPSVGPAFLLQAVAHQTVKSQTSINLRYYHHKKHCFFDELLKHQQRFFQYHAKRREREKVRFLRHMKIIRFVECCMEDCTSLNDAFRL
jgi:hypothetical protein